MERHDSRFAKWLRALLLILVMALTVQAIMADDQPQTPPPARTKKLNIIRTGRLEKDGLVTQFYQFGSRRCEFLVELLNNYKSEKGIIKAYPELSVLSVTDIAEKVADIDKILEIIDTPDPQISIESQIVDLSLDKDLQWGGELTSTRGQSNHANNLGDEAKITLNPEDYLQQLLNFQGGSISFLDAKGTGTFNVIIRAMARKGKADIKSTPRVTVVNGQEATLITGQDFPYVASSSMIGGAVQSTIGYKEVGIQLKVIPFFVSNDVIELSVSPSVSVVTAEIQIGGAGVPVVSKRGITTKVNVKSGQTLVIGGLLRDEKRTSERKVPLLGDIPILGYFFTSKRDQDYKSELLFLITPRLVESIPAEARKTSFPELEQLKKDLKEEPPKEPTSENKK
ncbi:MAG: hypothetical protein V1701_12745 [Planctomycetota bacterium]